MASSLESHQYTYENRNSRLQRREEEKEAWGCGVEEARTTGEAQRTNRSLHFPWLLVPESVFPEITLNYQYLQSFLNS